MKFDEFLRNSLGEIGKFQLIQLCITNFPIFILSIDAYSWSFASIEPTFRCKFPNDTGKYQTDLLTFSKCYDRKTEERKNISEWGKQDILCDYSEKCEMANSVCSEHVFDHSFRDYTATEKWDFVCDYSWMASTIQSVYYLGMMIGSFAFGVIGDRCGRKIAFYTTLVLQIPFGFILAFSPYWWLYMFARFMFGISHAGTFLLSSVLGMESFGPKYRKSASTAIGIFSCFGMICLGVIEMYVTNFTYVHLICAIPTVLYLSYWWLVPESIRWLVSKQKFENADRVIRKAAKLNGREIKDGWWEELSNSSSGKEGAKTLTVLDLFRTPKIRRRTLVLMFVWPVTSCVYYGFSLKSNVLGGDLYLTFLVATCCEIPGILLSHFLIDLIGRKILLAGCHAIATAALAASLIMGDNLGFTYTVIQMAIAKGSITAAFCVAYTYSPELYPTPIRNRAMGVLLFLTRFGGIMASYISMYISERYGKIYMVLPFAICSAIVAALTLIFLPETKGEPMPDYLEDIENPENQENNNETDDERSDKGGESVKSTDNENNTNTV